jgi:hypothetical protein
MKLHRKDDLKHEKIRKGGNWDRALKHSINYKKEES